ncbi:hypothetical protein [Shewanella sp. SR44-3]|uniref:hypothetical protein n=1 Tax=Shewanella sp. SR44-3 TaxID=2760936 RepID=UPI0015FC3D4B|nr:hypothetical protein [Shewanella sp. SR44-3]MBB1268966.1 hypothetical protein [Shewanella sp. SR44-3]
MKRLFSGFVEGLRLINLCLFSMLLSPAALAANCSQLESLNWLLGDWQLSSDKLIISEHWQQTSPMTFEGLGVSERRPTPTQIAAKNSDNPTQSTTSANTESLRLVQMSNEIFFIAKVASNPLPVAFKLTQCANKMAVFENPHHDFPQTLSYQLIHSPQGDKQLKVKVFAANNSGFEINFSAIEPYP